MFHLLCILCGLAAGPATAPARSADVPSDSIVTLRLLASRTENPVSLGDHAMRTFQNEFLREHPHIRIEEVRPLVLHNQFQFDAVKMSLSSGLAPDIIKIPTRNAGLLMEQGLVAPLDDYLAGWDRQLSFGDSLREAAIRPATRYRGRTYFINDSRHPTVLLYRKDRFAEAGLTRPPATWDELLAYCRILTDPATDRYGMALYGPPAPPTWEWSLFLYQAGGSYFRQDADGTWHANLDTPEAEAAVAFYRDLRAGTWVRDGDTLSGAVRAIPRLILEEFGRGRAAMMMGASWRLLSFNDPQVAAAPLPAGPGGPATIISGMQLGINAASSRAVRDAAFAYLKATRSRRLAELYMIGDVQEGKAGLKNARDLAAHGLDRYTGAADRDPRAHADSVSLHFAHPEVYGPPAASNIYGALKNLLNKAIGPNAYDMDIKAELAALNRRIEYQRLGNIPPRTMHRRRIATATVLLVLGLLMTVLLGWYAWRSIGSAERFRADPLPKRTHAWAWALMLPAVASVLLWQYYPLARGLAVAFQEYRVLGPGIPVGIDNFVTAFWRPMFWRAFANSLLYVGLTLAMGFVLPIALAVLLQELPRGGGVYRTIYYLPAVISPLVVTMLWMGMYHPEPEGFLNRLMTGLGLPMQTWLADPRLAMLCIVIPGIWATAGAGSILYQAAMYGIPADLYEQADIDGAGFGRKLWHVTLPALKPLIIIQLTGTVIGAFHATQRVLVMGRSGPMEQTTTLGIEIFRNAFEYMRFGYATAVAWIMGAFLVGFTVFQLNLFRRIRFAVRGNG